LVDLGGFLAWLKLEEHVFGWLGRASIKFCCTCTSIVFLALFQVCKWDSYSVGDKIFLGFKNICVCVCVCALLKSVILCDFRKTFDNSGEPGSSCLGKLDVIFFLSSCSSLKSQENQANQSLLNLHVSLRFLVV